MARKRTVYAIRKKDELKRAVLLTLSSCHINTAREENFLKAIHTEKNKEFFKNNNIPEPVIKTFDGAVFYVFDTTENALAFRLFLDSDHLSSIDRAITDIVNDHELEIEECIRIIKSMKRNANWWRIIGGKNG